MEASNAKDENKSGNDEQVLDFDLDHDNRDIRKNLLRSLTQALSRPFRRKKDEPPL